MKKEKKVKRKLTKKGKLKATFLIIMLICVAIIITLFLVKGRNTGDEIKKNVVDQIEKFSYTVSDTDTKLFKDTFKELKNVLNQKEIDNKEYAKLIGKLFIIDFYTLDNKITKNDVGGVQFVYTSYQADFIDKARDSIYKQVKSNLDDDRNQKLPEVSSVTVVSIEEVVPSVIFESKDFKGDNEADCYEIKLSWTYKDNDNFQTEATIVVVRDADKLSVAKLE